MFDDEASPENRDWRDEHDGMIADAIAGILSKALPAHAEDCIGCHRCERNCPFGVKIAQRMRQTARLFGL